MTSVTSEKEAEAFSLVFFDRDVFGTSRVKSGAANSSL